MKDRVNSLSHECISLTEAEVRIEAGSGHIMGYQGHSRYNEDFRGRTRYSLNNRGSYGYNMRGNQRYRGNNNNNNRRGNYRNQNYDRNRSRSFERQSRNRRNNRSLSNSRSRSGSRVSTNRDRIRCLNVGNTTTLQENVQPDKQVGRQNKYNKSLIWDEDQTILQTSLMDTDEVQLTTTAMEARDNLNL